MSGGIYTTDKSKTIASLADVDLDNIQNGQAPVYDATQELFTNQTVLTPSSLPSGSSGDVIISDGSSGLSSTSKLNVNPSNGTITGVLFNVDGANIKVGSSAGDSAGNDNISIGYQTGTNAGNYATAVGTIAGQNGGTNSVSLGFNAQANDNNCIVINGSGTLTQSLQTDSCYINPVRNLNATTLPNPYVVQYDDTNKEVIKSEDLHIRDIQNRNIENNGTLTNVSTASLYNGQLTAGVGGNRIVAGAGNSNLVVDLTNQRVGINNASPQYALDVVGHIRLQSGGADRLIFNNTTVGEDIADVDTIVDGTDGGIWGVRTRVNGGSLTEKLRINNVGAIGLGGANYGASGQVIVSRGSGNPVEWADQTDTTYTQGTGISIVGTTINNTAPDQTVVLTQGGETTITGTYPNFTISSTDTTYTQGTGISIVGTTINTADPALLTGSGTGVVSIPLNTDTALNWATITTTGDAPASDLPTNTSIWTATNAGLYHIIGRSWFVSQVYDQISIHKIKLQYRTSSGVPWTTIGEGQLSLGASGDQAHVVTCNVERYVSISTNNQLRIVVFCRVQAGGSFIDYNEDKTIFQIFRVK